MGMCDEWIYMLLLMNMCFVISWGIISVGRASTLRAEGCWLNFCILQPITLALAPRGRSHIFASISGDRGRCRVNLGLFWIYSDHQPFFRQ